MSLRSFELAIRKTSRRGGRTALLLLGNGVHVQAARESGLRIQDPWSEALRQIAKEAGVREVGNAPPSALHRWDDLVRATSRRRSNRATTHKVLRARMAKRLVGIEQKRRRLPLFGRILARGFENLLSLNADRSLALHSRRERFVEGFGWFGRHSLVPGADGVESRVWYPHGDTLDAESIRLGTIEHAEQLMMLEASRSSMMNDWVESRIASYSYPGARPSTKLMSPARFYERNVRSATSWYPLFFSAPMVIVGANLALEEWPIWWLLHQRARNLTPFRKAAVPPTYLLRTRAERQDHLRGSPAEIEVVEFPNHDSLWRALLRE